MKFIFYESELKTGVHELRLLVFLIVFLGAYPAIGQGSVCSDPIGDTGADPFCSVAGIVFPNCNSLNSDCTVEAESGPDYGCLISQPFPAWYYLRIKDSGTMEFTIVQTQNEDGTGTQLDVDFICYGPFDNPVTPCASDLTFSNTISCSYSSSYTEFMTIPNAEAGEYYLVLITNFSQLPGFINFQKTGGTGVTDCSILEVLLGPNQTVCEGETVALNGTTDGAVSYEWAIFNESTSVYDMLIGETTPFLNVTTSGRYQISVEDTEGDVVTDEIEITFVDRPLVNASVPDLVECASSVMNQDVSIFDLTKNNINIPETPNLDYKIVYYANEENYNSEKPIPESEISAFKNTDNPQTIYASIVNTALDCVSDVPAQFDILVTPLPFFMDNESFIGKRSVCVFQDGTPQNAVELGEDLEKIDGQKYIYDWTPDNLDIDGDGKEDAIFVVTELTEEQNYTVSITRVGGSAMIPTCTNAINPETGEKYEITLIPTAAPNKVNYEVREEAFFDSYTISAIPEFSIGDVSDYEYQLNDGEYQDSPIFTNLSSGDYMITIRNKFGCTPEIRSELIELLGYPKYFTPNGDGFHDRWSLVNIEDQSTAQIYIFDRYGKLLKQLRAGGSGWDGTYNGRNMPSSEYWFRVEFDDPTSLDTKRRVFSGSFSLIR